ncbi:hypothetical protein [Bacillus thuringiensis]|uniref:hypothetical protein n=1 Tax=Bacillus cereus group TaxID=86661 RepID=UPI000BF31300|nr:hypothetical protein [Bacillus thuringiensis]MCU5527795.1 hypothetical protein [Bacillus cereus]MCU5543006.1 hypothetical protein [Bacillus cereus]PEW23967.1 hypothetical protein CN427_28075 [Bacillus thuringiensis]PFE89813.1 hypothetical protein CN325_28805 [Bacillus thuringiensis]HDR4895635.1 hypothetical protein [Bacillus cereus]
MTVIGDILKNPEVGWRRYDCMPSHSFLFEMNGFNVNDTYKNYYFGSTKDSYLRFKFLGKKLRVIAEVSSGPGNVSISIDGGEKEYFSLYKDLKGGLQEYTFLFEKQLSKWEIHEVIIKIESTTGHSHRFNAFDIDAQGEFLTFPKKGEELKEPESGWNRFDNTDRRIKYTGNWEEFHNDSRYHNGTGIYKNTTHGTEPVICEFSFNGTGLRIISRNYDGSGSYKAPIAITIDGVTETYSLIGSKVLWQALVYEKLKLEPGIHQIRIEALENVIDAIDVFGGELQLSDLIKKPKVSLYEKESGKIFVDDFDSINPKWLMSPSNEFNNAAKKGFLRMNHADNKDVKLLIDKPQSNFAIQVIADYAPTKEGDEGGLLIYQNEKNKVEFLESYSVNSSQRIKEWMAICKEDQWDFYTKTDTFFDYMDNDSLDAKRIGVVLKRGDAEGFVPLDINKIIMTTSNMLRLRQLYENYKVVLKDTTDNILSTNIVASAHTGIDILLPSLEFEGIIEIYDEENELLAKKQTTFYGGDMYCMGSSLQIKMNNDELNTTDPTNLGYMLNNERIVKMTIVNDNIGAATNIKLSIQQYMEKVGYTWARISLDGTNYLNEIQIDSIAAQSTRDFWVKIVKDTNLLAFEPIYFNVYLIHN